MLKEILERLEEEAEHAPAYDCEDCAYLAGLRTAIDIVKEFTREDSDRDEY